MGRKQKERQKKKNNQKLLAAATATATSTASATDGRSSSGIDGDVDGNVGVGVDVDVDVDVDGGVAAAKKGATMETTTIAICYHGSTAENFAKGSHFQMVINEWLTILIYYLADKDPKEVETVISNFHVKHEKLMNSPEFNQCIFAVGTDMFKKSYRSEEYSSSKQKLHTVLLFGITSKYGNSSYSTDREKYEKYNRDIMTDRGIINVLDRETNTFCNCMKPYKEESKIMGKLGMCFGCNQDFPKEKLRLCSRCLFIQYCGKECMKSHWPAHKQFCRPQNEH